MLLKIEAAFGILIFKEIVRNTLEKMTTIDVSQVLLQYYFFMDLFSNLTGF